MREDDLARQRHESATPPCVRGGQRGPMPATVQVYRREHPDHWEAIRAVAAQFPFVRLIEEPVRERVLEYPTTVSIDVVLGWPLAEQEPDGAFWGDVVQVRLETPGQRYPLGGIMAYVRGDRLEREAFREHQPDGGAVAWCDDFETWLAAMTTNMAGMALALRERGWLTDEYRPAADLTERQS